MQTNQNTTPESNDHIIEGAATTHRVMLELWERTASILSTEGLEWFAKATEQAEHLTGELEDVLEGLGCLVMSDRACGKKATDLCHYPTGNFQSADDVGVLLFFIAKNLDTIKGLIHVGSSAQDRLINPKLYSILNGDSHDK